jgi:hypothetical protein
MDHFYNPVYRAVVRENEMYDYMDNLLHGAQVGEVHDTLKIARTQAPFDL